MYKTYKKKKNMYTWHVSVYYFRRPLTKNDVKTNKKCRDGGGVREGAYSASLFS